MAQIKITVTDQEKEKYEQAAKKSGLSLSKYLKSRIDCRSVAESGKASEPVVSSALRNPRRNAPKTHLSVHIDSSLAEAMKQQAKDLGLSLQDYVSLLLIQKGKPVIIQFYADYGAELSLWFLEWMKDVDAIADAARISGGVLTQEEMDQAISDFTQAADDFRNAANCIDQKLDRYIADLNRQLRNAKEGNEG